MLQEKLTNPQNGLQGYVELKTGLKQNSIKSSTTTLYFFIVLEISNQAYK